MMNTATFAWIGPFQKFFKTEAAGGLVLMACTCAALVLANSGFADAYHHVWEIPIVISASGHTLSLTAHQWINDGLMAIFFLLVGLEIKREVMAGELASLRQAALPIAAALGGMLAPAAIYVLVTRGGAGARGWAIAMATDIAFALGALALAAPRAPGGLKVFLAALAIVDDIGAVLVIAFFYTGHIEWQAIGMAALCVALLVALNLGQIRSLLPYLTIGAALWYFVHESGIHATIAGVLLAFAIPARTRLSTRSFSTKARDLLDEFDRSETGDLAVLTSKSQQEAIFAIKVVSHEALAPLLRLEHALHGLSAFVVMPLFAFSNAGVSLSGSSTDRVTLAVVLGLAVGKPLGITSAAFLSVRSRLATLPQGVNWTALHGCGWFGGIGFTMALFIATLAFEGTRLLDSAKIGILAASVFAGTVGAVVVRRGIRPVHESTQP